MKTYSIDKKVFKKNKEMFKNNFKNVKSSFAAFNANVDAITKIDKKFPINFKEVKSNSKLPNSVKSMKDLKNALVHSMKHGKAVELKIENKELYTKLMKSLNFRHKRIGGQMGIVANTLSKLGVKKPVIFSNLLSNEQAKLFESNVLFPSVKNNRIVFKRAKQAGRKKDPTRENIIIEYSQGFTIECKDETFKTPRNNRFIISSPVHKSPPLIPENLMRKDLFNTFKRAFISGYHHVKKKNHSRLFNKWVNQLKKIKELNPDLLIHLEYVDLHKEWLNNELLKVIKQVHSFGLNEAETASLMEYLSLNKERDKIIKSKNSADSLIKAGKILMKLFGLKRLSIHTLQFIISITVKDYPVKVNDLIHANVYAMRVVNSKGVHGMSGFVKGLNDINKYELSSIGLKASRVKEDKDYNIIVIPNFNTETVPVEYTVGLGDTVSSAAFYAEEAVSK